MIGSRFPTRHAEVSNTVVLIGTSGVLAYTSEQAAMEASGAQLLRAGVSEAATVCAEVRPYAIVIGADIYEFGGREFDLLARDIGAGLVVAPAKIDPSVLTAVLQEEARRLG